MEECMLLGGNVHIHGIQKNDDCRSICESPYLHVQDSHTAHDNWSCIGAYHVFLYRPATTTNGQRNTARLGLKVFTRRLYIQTLWP